MPVSTRRSFRIFQSALVAIGLALAIPFAAVAQPMPTHATESASIAEDVIFQRWLRNGREVASWRTQIGGARFDIVTATLWPNPQLALSGNVLLAGTPPDGNLGLAAQVTASLPIFGQIAAREYAARRALALAEISVVAVVWARAGDIQSAMVDRAFADARIAMLELNITELARIERIISLRVAAAPMGSTTRCESHPPKQRSGLRSRTQPLRVIVPRANSWHSSRIRHSPLRR